MAVLLRTLLAALALLAETVAISSSVGVDEPAVRRQLSRQSSKDRTCDTYVQKVLNASLLEARQRMQLWVDGQAKMQVGVHSHGQALVETSGLGNLEAVLTAEPLAHLRSIGLLHEPACTEPVDGPRWVHTPPESLHLYFTAEEQKALRGQASGSCLPDGHARTNSRYSSLEPLTLHWSECGPGACQGLVGVARLLATHEQHSLLLVGDSMMGQRFEAAKCDLFRSGCQQVAQRSFGIAPPGTAAAKQGWNKVSALDFACENNKINMTLAYHELTTWASFLEVQGGTTDSFVSTLNRFDVVLANSGLHNHKGSEALEGLVQALVQAVTHRPTQDAKKAPVIVWAETNMQHYRNGEFTEKRKCELFSKEKDGCDPAYGLCLPIQDVKRHSKNIEMDAAFDKLGARKFIRILPVERFTMHRWDVHPEGPQSKKLGVAGDKTGTLTFQDDCTHVAYTPTYYTPQWHALHQLLEQQLKA